MEVIFRVDASNQIGSGHVQRCLTLADQLKRKGTRINFIIRDQEGNMRTEIDRKGYSVYLIGSSDSIDEITDAKETQFVIEQFFDRVDLLIVDHYHLSSVWESRVKPHVRSLMVIDDLANRKHNCDLLLDQNYYRRFETRYRNLVPSQCCLLLGPRHLLLRSEFTQVTRKPRDYKKIKNILIFYGGSDPTNETEKVLKVLERYPIEDTNINVVVGSNNRQAEQIKKLCLGIGATFHYNIDYMAKLIAEADLAFGAGGIAMWERCYLGLPTVVTIVADNQYQATVDAEEECLIINLGWHENVTSADYQKLLMDCILDPTKLKAIESRLIHFFDFTKKENSLVVSEIFNFFRKTGGIGYGIEDWK